MFESVKYSIRILKSYLNANCMIMFFQRKSRLKIIEVMKISVKIKIKK
jgi:hypothetical protein